MSTNGIELQRREKEGVGVGEQALTMAIGIVVERVARLSDDDKADLFELVKVMGNAQTEEELESVRVAMKEILDQDPGHTQRMPLPRSGERPEKLKKWVGYVGGRVRELRKAADMTQEGLAAKAELPQSHISRIESGEVSPTNITLEKIAKALGRPLTDLDPTT